MTFALTLIGMKLILVLLKRGIFKKLKSLYIKSKMKKNILNTHDTFIQMFGENSNFIIKEFRSINEQFFYTITFLVVKSGILPIFTIYNNFIKKPFILKIKDNNLYINFYEIGKNKINIKVLLSQVSIIEFEEVVRTLDLDLKNVTSLMEKRELQDYETKIIKPIVLIKEGLKFDKSFFKLNHLYNFETISELKSENLNKYIVTQPSFIVNKTTQLLYEMYPNSKNFKDINEEIRSMF